MLIDVKQLHELVAASKKYSSTEEFLLYVAAEDGILEICHKLIDGGDQNGEFLSSFTGICSEHSVNPDALLLKIREIVRALSPNNHEITGAYASLGLEDSATLEEVKKAFRKLSMKYHPDHSEGDAETEKFLTIRNAYQSIIDDISSSSTQQAATWIQSSGRSRSVQRKKNKKFIYTTVAMVTLLLLVSIFLAGKQKQRTLYKRSEMFVSQQKNKSSAKNVIIPEVIAAEKTEQIEKEAPEKPDITFQELEAVIPPDPLLLATLEHPFPFRTNTAILLKKKTINKPGEDDKTKDALLEEKIKLLEQKIREIEQKPVEVKHALPEKPVFSRKTPVPSKAYLKTARIRKFLDIYTATYTGRDVDRLMKLFTPHALENGTPVNTLVSTYTDLFQKTSAIHMKIFNFQWKEYLNDLQIHGYFDAEYTYKTGSTKKYLGEVTFHLTSVENDELRIKKFSYTLKN